jgi:hypothetical protein
MNEQYLVVMGNEIRGPMSLIDALALVRADPNHRFIHLADAALRKPPCAEGAWETYRSLVGLGAEGNEG